MIELFPVFSPFSFGLLLFSQNDNKYLSNDIGEFDYNIGLI